MSLAYRVFVRLLILLFFFLLAVVVFAESPRRPSLAGGTLVAYFATRDEIFLFSDGRAIDHAGGAIHDDWSKVHYINERVGLLEGGIYIPNLASDVARECRERKTWSADEVAEIASERMKRAVAELIGRSPDSAALRNARFYIIVAGFDRRERPRVFLIDSQTTPCFSPIEQPCDLTRRQVAIGAISTRSGSSESPAALLKEYFTPAEIAVSNRKTEVEHAAALAFEKTKLRLAETDPTIGGDSFSIVLR
jgi:hypothetical protein